MYIKVFTELTSYGSPPTIPKLPARPSTPVKIASPVLSQPGIISLIFLKLHFSFLFFIIILFHNEKLDSDKNIVIFKIWLQGFPSLHIVMKHYLTLTILLINEVFQQVV